MTGRPFTGGSQLTGGLLQGKAPAPSLAVRCQLNHKLWGSTDTNRRGEYLVDYLITTDLDILNAGTIPTFRNSVREKVIDIILWPTWARNLRKTNWECYSTHVQAALHGTAMDIRDANWCPQRDIYVR